MSVGRVALRGLITSLFSVPVLGLTIYAAVRLALIRTLPHEFRRHLAKSSRR